MGGPIIGQMSNIWGYQMVPISMTVAGAITTMVTIKAREFS